MWQCVSGTDKKPDVLSVLALEAHKNAKIRFTTHWPHGNRREPTMMLNLAITITNNVVRLAAKWSVFCEWRSKASTM